jgi:hypothetical protein
VNSTSKTATEPIPTRESHRIGITKRIVYTFDLEEGVMEDIASMLSTIEHHDLNASQTQTRAEFFSALDRVNNSQFS